MITREDLVDASECTMGVVRVAPLFPGRISLGSTLTLSRSAILGSYRACSIAEVPSTIGGRRLLVVEGSPGDVPD